MQSMRRTIGGRSRGRGQQSQPAKLTELHWSAVNGCEVSHATDSRDECGERKRDG